MTTVAGWLNEVSDLPRTDCEFLLTDLAGISRARILTEPEHELTDASLKDLLRAAEQLRDDVPEFDILNH